MGFFLDGDGDSPVEKPDWSSLIGIITAIVGNVLIALALNVQRYAHTRLHRRRTEARVRARQALKKAARACYGATGTTVTSGTSGTSAAARRSEHYDHEPDETLPFPPSTSSGADSSSDSDSDPDSHGTKVASTYLQDPYWWLGQILIIVGEMGNFLAYGFAPASIVSPLGVVALISNCIIAPLLFKEIFRARDFWGVVVAMAGAVTVVLSAKPQETKLAPHDVWRAITTPEFELYMAVSCGLIVLLMWLSPRYGHRTILVDLGLVGLLGGYTALSTKGVSSMLSSTLLGAFTTPVTFALILVLLSTAVLQVRYVNKALQRFDSTQVIPIQFVLFTLCVITGSAVLYRDFERTTTEQAVKFMGGCLLTFFGVFLITSGRPRRDADEETLSDAADVEETIRLFDQDPSPTPVAATPSTTRRHSSFSARSRPSLSSRVSFKDMRRPISPLVTTAVPSQRARPPPITPGMQIPGTAVVAEGERSSLQINPWREGEAHKDPDDARPFRPAIGRPTASDASIMLSSPLADASPLSPTARHGPPLITLRTPSLSGAAPAVPDYKTAERERPATPAAVRPTFSLHHYDMISPSPFSSTVSAVVAEKLLVNAHGDGGVGGSGSSSNTVRRSAARRSRPSLRNSLFVPSDEAPWPRGSDPESQSAGAAENSAGLRRLASAGQAGEADRLLATARAAGGRGLRVRARSLSNVLGGFLGARRKPRRTSQPEPREGVERSIRTRPAHGSERSETL